jgi:DNA primase catalytic core
MDEQYRWATAPVSRERLIALNQQAAHYYRRNYPHSWAAEYLRHRLGTDLLDDDRFTPGYAPPGAHHLVTHLRRHGATDQDILAAGLGRISVSGRLIDQFRDRLVFPIHGPDGHIHGFIARRNPTHHTTDGHTGRGGPKYLNTPDTDLYSKGAQLFGLHEGRAALAAGATPTLVEGPLDAIAVTLAAAAESTHIGVATLGTAPTEQQADQLLPYLGPDRAGVLVATDADQPGWKAAQRAYWHLVARGANPGHTLMPAGADPAQVLHHHGPAAIQRLLAASRPLARSLLDDPPPDGAGTDATIRRVAAIIAALPPEQWIDHLLHAVTRLHTPPDPLQRAVIDAASAWTNDPRGQARRHISAIPDTASSRAPAAGYDMAGHLPRLVRQQPLSPTHPARDLQCRLIHAAAQAAADPTEATRHADRAAITAEVRARLADQHRRTESSEQPGIDQHTNPEQQRPEDRWRTLIAAIDAAILTEDGWTALAATLDHAAATGLNVADELPRLATTDGPLPPRHAAVELRYRILNRVNPDPNPLRPAVPEPRRRPTPQPPQLPTRSQPHRPAPRP